MRELAAAALEIQERTYGQGHLSTAITLINLGTAESKLGNHATARTLLQSAVEIRVREFGTDNLEAAHVLLRLAEVYHAADEVELALESLEQAHGVYVQQLGRHHPRSR